MTTPTHLPPVQSLSKILPTGTEGGKEFGRIIDLLLFNELRSEGQRFQPLNDAAGDFRGLDSYRYSHKGDQITGYQYKFYSSPLSSQHRSSILGALREAAKDPDNNIQTYVLVTPDDLTNSGRRADQGDVEWFEKLRIKFKDSFTLEHIGHTKIVSMFMKAPHVCLFYYPELVPFGLKKRKTIQEVRSQYDRNMRRRFGRIEFVGMSVYKEEASRRVPLQNIYIPLGLVPETSEEETDLTPRINPKSLLAPGRKSVVLGDPGSGKSTLVSFLALLGITPELQARCAGNEDDRLPIVVTLRRYADELKNNKNLSLLEYISQSVKADFSLLEADQDFFEAHIESGKAIMLFDGLDELPGPQLKDIVRRRIDSFCEAHPLNTTIVTSRIVGYEAQVRFDPVYHHYRVAKLRLDEINAFVSDWYKERIEDPLERDRNILDLTKVISNADNDAIRDLSRNPLLLTIVALVHRIDAVLPDQRVVLYQKCTETLLNTWSKAKKQDDEPVKGRIEQRNRLRIEAIAYWMHRNSLQAKGRAVAPHDDIVQFLTQHIDTNEKKRDDDDPAQDQAEEFFSFVKSSAGLMIEAGDRLYSFIHLTFQEYLSATYLTTFGEVGGAQSIWDELGGDLQNPRWREVVRLLVASLKSSKAQAFFVEKLLDANAAVPSFDCTLLLIGLLRDGIEPAEEKVYVIFEQVIGVLIATSSSNDIRSINTAAKAWAIKEARNREVVVNVLKNQLMAAANDFKVVLALVNQSLGLGQLDAELLNTVSFPHQDIVLPLLFGPSARSAPIDVWESMYLRQTLEAFRDPESNAAAAIGLGISILLDDTDVADRLLSRSFSLLSSFGKGPYGDYTLNLVVLACQDIRPHPSLLEAVKCCIDYRMRDSGRPNSFPRIDEFFAKWAGYDGIRSYNADQHEFSMEVRDKLRKMDRRPRLRMELMGSDRDRSAKRTREMSLIKRSMRGRLTDIADYSKMMLASDVMRESIIPSLVRDLKLQPEGHWIEAFRGSLSTLIPEVLKKYFDHTQWLALAERLHRGTASIDDLKWAAWLVQLDVWIRWSRPASSSDPTGLEEVIAAAEPKNYGPLQFSLAFRQMFFGDDTGYARAVALSRDKSSDTYRMLLAAGWPSEDDIARSPARGGAVALEVSLDELSDDEADTEDGNPSLGK
jgi:energy-coupling factor transporter ATP-binding protein EcfA2